MGGQFSIAKQAGAEQKAPAKNAKAAKMLGLVKPLDERPPVAVKVEQEPVSEPVITEAPVPDVVEAPSVDAEATAGEGRAQEDSTPPKSSSRRRKPPKAAGPVPSSTTPSALIFQIDPQLDKRLEAYRTVTRKSYHHVMLDAVEHTYDRLPELVLKALGRDKEQKPKRSLFDRGAAPVVEDKRGERVSHTVRILESNRTALDEITAEVGAPSRNFMLTVALDAYLPPA